MVRSLWNAATGMNGQQANIDTISNNLSNVNTTGFKQHRVEFEDLLYQTRKLAGTPATEDTITPVGVQMGHGVKVGATQRIMSQGSLQATGVDTDLAEPELFRNGLIHIEHIKVARKLKCRPVDIRFLYPDLGCIYLRCETYKRHLLDDRAQRYTWHVEPP